MPRPAQKKNMKIINYIFNPMIQKDTIRRPSCYMSMEKQEQGGGAQKNDDRGHGVETFQEPQTTEPQQ